MPYTANNSDFIIESIGGGIANANGYFRNVYYSSSLSLYGYSGPTNYGYTSGGDSATPGDNNIIDRFPFALAITNATDVGDLSEPSKFEPAGMSSTTYGYTAGGRLPAPGGSNVIDRFPFALAITNASDVGDLTNERYASAGNQSTDFGYVSGGDGPAAPNDPTKIERFPFALSITNATNVGDLSQASRKDQGSASSSTHGYEVAGRGGTSDPGTGSNYIERFPFALAITNATDVGDLTIERWQSSGTHSSTYGYTSGGDAGPVNTNVIDRFPFALAITNATDVGDLTVARGRLPSSGQNSTTYGYLSAGTPNSNIIERFPFALAITNATDVGDSFAGRETPTGNSY